MTPACRWNFVCRVYSNLGMLKILFGLFPLARYFCKRLQKMYGLGEPARYLNMLYPHFQKESCSFDVGQAVMSSRRKCDKRHISFLTSIYRDGTTQKVCSFALHILRQERLHCIPRKLDMCGGCCDAAENAAPLRHSHGRSPVRTACQYQVWLDSRRWLPGASSIGRARVRWWCAAPH